jgi:hypothetical protein
MKRKMIMSVAVIVALILCSRANAQILERTTFGIQAGLTSSSASLKDLSTESVSKYHVGGFLQIPLAAGFSFQPGLLYQVKGASMDSFSDHSLESSFESLETEVGYLEVPLQIQWGPDLIAFRPYVFAEPFLGYAIAVKSEGQAKLSISSSNKSLKDSGLSRLEYGLGLGGGIELWKLQLSAKYFWNMGSLYSESQTAADATKGVTEAVKAAFKDKKSFNGIMFTLGFKF